MLHETRRLAVPLWKRRKQRGFSQTDFARLLGVSRSSVQRWEEDGCCQPLAMIAWARCLDFSIGLRHVGNESCLWLGR
ncbi:helix-turn-helix transcriptional regulator [Catenulispora sp. GAS73]|uniref:helix-turn-helix transcriptional regulator n=1 Tax=Catenulispora sp. GAS73 TaxID=3156269 RepID=UPI0035122E69